MGMFAAIRVGWRWQDTIGMVRSFHIMDMSVIAGPHKLEPDFKF